MLRLAFRNVLRRPIRNALAISGLAFGVAMFICLTSFGHGYRNALGNELQRMGLQLMLVPIGCPYDAAARVLKGNALDSSLPESALETARSDPAVAIAAPLLMAALSRPANGRADMWVGLDESALSLKPWWQVRAGNRWFTDDNSVILGCDAAEVEMRTPGDSFFCPEGGQKLRVAGILERSGTSDDSLFFVPLKTAQRMFKHEGRLTAIAIRLNDPALVREAGERLQQIPGAQVVTLTEMMGAFLNLIGAVRTLVFSLIIVVATISTLSIFNTLLAAVTERTNELAVMRALGASRWQILNLITVEAMLLTAAGSFAGLALALSAGRAIELVVRHFVPFAPPETLLAPSAAIIAQSLALGFAVGIVAALFPAWRAAQLAPARAAKPD